MFAFLPSIGFQEMFVLLVIGLLLYGRNLPEAGRTLGKAVAHLRRGFVEFKQQFDRDGDLRDVKKSLQDSAKELRNIGQVPRAMADPQRAIRDFANDTMRAPLLDQADTSELSDLTDESLSSPLTAPPPAAKGDDDAVTSPKDPS